MLMKIVYWGRRKRKWKCRYFKWGFFLSFHRRLVNEVMFAITVIQNAFSEGLHNMYKCFIFVKYFIFFLHRPYNPPDNMFPWWRGWERAWREFLWGNFGLILWIKVHFCVLEDIFRFSVLYIVECRWVGTFIYDSDQLYWMRNEFFYNYKIQFDNIFF